MTDHEWLACEDPHRMIQWVTCGGPSGSEAADLERWRRKLSDRKMRLFACACCRYVWDRLGESARRTIEAAERVVDGRAPAALPVANVWLIRLRDRVTHKHSYLPAILWTAGLEVEPAIMAALLRDILDGPSRQQTLCGLERRPFHNQWAHVDINGSFWLEAECPACRRLRTPTALAIASRIYDEYDFDALPVLADALEEAGCREESLLRHLRGWEPFEFDPEYRPGQHRWRRRRAVHVRGCHALDLILGKE